MKRMLGMAVAVLLAVASVAKAQGFDAAGTRAGGMGGAFVAVADDASAAYWNPAGFASGSYFSLVLDRRGDQAAPEGFGPGGSRSGFLLALGAPALGLTYYRLRTATVEPTDLVGADRNTSGPGEVRVSSLVTHHAGATLVQSVLPGVAVGATLKLVRGIAASAVTPAAGDRDDLLDDAADVLGQATNKFDADIGLMATAGRVKAGLTIRNVTQPAFESAGDGRRLRLERQARVGLAVMPVAGWTVAADFDLLETEGIHGRFRDVAFGGEGRVARRGFVRAGMRMNTASGDLGRAATAAFGGSYAVTASVLVDGQVTVGSEKAPTGWGVAARFVY